MYNAGMAKSTRRVPMNLKVSPKIKAWVDEQVDRGSFRDAGEYLELLLDERRRVPTIYSMDELDGLIAEAVASGPPRPMTSRDWARLRRAATAGAAKRRSQTQRRRRSA